MNSQDPLLGHRELLKILETSTRRPRSFGHKKNPAHQCAVDRALRNEFREFLLTEDLDLPVAFFLDSEMSCTCGFGAAFEVTATDALAVLPSGLTVTDLIASLKSEIVAPVFSKVDTQSPPIC